jgi:hypothetical protein
MMHDSNKQAMTETEYFRIQTEIDNQSKWRDTADKEADYADGNQLDTELLQRQRELGIPPAMEDMIGPTLLSLQGYEATTRTDWRVTPDGDIGSLDIADALNFKLNKTERASGADRACSAAFRGQIVSGIGWVEVARESDPFRFPYRCQAVHRNEIFWDMTTLLPQDMRWLIRQRFLAKSRAAQYFPQHEDDILRVGHSGNVYLDGGSSTGLQNSWGDGRAMTTMENRWYNVETDEICIAELWYRRWVDVVVMKLPDGRALEFDEDNPRHQIAVATNQAKLVRAIAPKVRQSYWLGSMCLYDGASPYKHNFFPYVQFVGFREDMTGVPYGYVRRMKYPQDALNTGISKLRWGMAAVRTERTKGAVAMSDAQFRRQISRIDADIVLDAQHMALPGARFEVKRDFQLNDQQFQLMADSRTAIERVSGITQAFMGQSGTATSGVQENAQIEKSNQSIGMIMDNFRDARTQVGEMLLSMIIEDMGTGEQTIIIEGDAVREDRSVTLNKPEIDPRTGWQYLSNDIQKTRLKVALEEVPSTNSYRAQQLQAMTEAIKPLPPEYLAAAVPFLTTLMDVPFKRDLVEAFRSLGEQQTPEQIEQRIQQEVQDALVKAGNELKTRELELKERKADSEIKGLDAKTVQILVQAMYSAMQGGAQIAQMPTIAPLADKLMQGGGYQRPNPGGIDPNFPVPGEAIPRPAQTRVNVDSEIPPEEIRNVQTGQGVQQNTSPAFPPVPEQPATGQNGIETPGTQDNLPV